LSPKAKGQALERREHVSGCGSKVSVSFGPIRLLGRVAGAGLCVACAIALGGCLVTEPVQGPVADGVPPITTPTIERDADVKYYPSDEPLRLAIEQFNRGNYGLAQRYFRDAVEKAPRDGSAWIGLAASYDHLGRFDLADQAYRQALKLVGETTALLNNRGYSYLLRGNLIDARRYFLKAYARDPGNPIILNNLKLLDGSERYIVRAPDTLPPDAR
jgi:tetratricopeptide (TPR) repeat protein